LQFPTTGSEALESAAEAESVDDAGTELEQEELLEEEVVEAVAAAAVEAGTAAGTTTAAAAAAAAAAVELEVEARLLEAPDDIARKFI
jgi:hypothetical protein